MWDLLLSRLVAAVALAAAAGAAHAATLAGSRTWSGVVRVEEDLYVPPDATLEILPGTRVVFAAAPGTKTDPVYWSGGTEIAVAGALRARGTSERPVVFEGEGPWGGLVAAPGGQVDLETVRIRGAQEGLLIVAARGTLRDVRIESVEYGLVLGPGARLDAQAVKVEGCRVGVLDQRRAGSGESPTVEVVNAADARRLVNLGAARESAPTLPAPPAPEQGRTELLGEYTVERSETWRGEVVVSGRVTVVPGAVLTLAPGTRVAFRRVDSDGDGLGEAELLVLGGIRSLGTLSAPVVFESAEGQPRMGDWDKVSLISSEDPANLFRYTVFRHGVQALHAHFSRFVGEDCYFEENLRAAQFQESEGARLVRCVFRGNKQALRFRDSAASVTDSVFLENLYAVHAFRCELEFRGNTLEGNALGGFLAKESRVIFRGNRFSDNRDGARMKDPGSRAEVVGNRFETSAEDALSLSQVEGVVEGNRFDGAGLDLVGFEDSPVVLRGNEFGRAGRDALHLKGGIDVAAPGNLWGDPDPERRIHDRGDDPALGRVRWEPALSAPAGLVLPEPSW